MKEALTINDLYAGYNGESILEGINLTVRAKDYIGIVGPNGGGKTTLLKVLLGLLKPRRGTVQVLGKPAVEARNQVGYVPQHMDFDRDFPIRVWDVVHMGRLSRRGLVKRYTQTDHDVVWKILEQIELADLAGKTLSELSGGQRQRVLIARALAVEPALLLLDEPTASIDPRVTGSIYELLRELNESMAIVLVTHDMGVISSHVKTVGCLNRTLHYHGTRELTAEMLEAAYQCPIDLIAHGVPHRVFPEHEE